MNAIIEKVNSIGCAFIEFALPILIQASVLIILLLLADLVLHKRVRAVFRYWILMLILVKLILPTSLSGPFSLGYWFGDEIASVDVSQNTYEPPPAISESPAPVLPYIDVSNVRPAIYPPSSVIETKAIGAEPIGSSPVQIQWQGVVFLLWLAIVLALLLLLAQRAIFVRSLVAQAKDANRPMRDALDDCRKRMKVRAKPSLRISPNATSPAVCGLFRPVILVPNNLSTALGSEDLRVVLLHELAHIKRGDLWVNLAQTLLQIIYFYNPLLWLANLVIRRAREQAVDEAVLVAMGEKASRYPETLVSVARLAFKRPALSLRLIGVVESKSALTARIKRILSRPMPKSAKLGIVGLLTIIVTAAILLPMAKGKWEKDIHNPVPLDEDGKLVITHALYMEGQPEEPVYRLEGKTYSDVEHVVAHIGELMKHKPFPYIRVYTTSQFQRQQQPIEQLGKLCREIGFINLEFKYDLERSNGELKATLPNGVTVELVGVCEHPSEGKQWWRPNGDELLEAPYDEIGGNVYPNGNEKSFEFAIWLRNLPAEHVNTKVRCEESVGGSTGGGSSPEKGGEYLSDFRWLATTFPKKLKACTVKVGVAAGQWQSVAQSNGKGFSSRGSELGGVSFTKAFEVEDGISITVADDILGRPCRVVAITNDGEVVKPVRSSGGSAGKARQTTVNFNNISLSDIKEFQFQTRPYEWAEFKDVSLEPDKDSLISKQDGNSKDLFGISDALAVSDNSGDLTIKSIRVAGLDGKKSSNKTSILVNVVNNSDSEVNLGLEYYTDSGTIAMFFSPGASSGAKVLKVKPNWQGQLEFPMSYNSFAKGGYIKIILARCSSDRIKGVSLPQSAEVIHEKQYGVISVGQQKQAVKLLNTLRTAKGRQRYYAAEELAKYGRSVVPAITEMLQDDNVWAAHALGQIGPEAEDAVPALIKSLTQGGVGGVRGFSASALRKIGPAAVPAIPALIGTLKDKHGNTRMHAADALGFLSTGEKYVVEALTAALNDEDETVRKVAIRSLKRIEEAIAEDKTWEVGKISRAAVEALFKDSQGTSKVAESGQSHRLQVCMVTEESVEFPNADLLVYNLSQTQSDQLYIQKKVLFDEFDFIKAELLQFDKQPQQIVLQFTKDAADRLKVITSANIRRRMAIVLDSKILAVFVVTDSVSSERLAISVSSLDNDLAKSITSWIETAISKAGVVAFQMTRHPDWSQADHALKRAMNRDASYSRTQKHMPQQLAIEAWNDFLKRDYLTEGQRIFALWRTASLYAYNIDSSLGEKHNFKKSKKLFKQVRDYAPNLWSNEIANAITQYASHPFSSKIEKARVLAESYKWVKTCTDDTISNSALRINRYGYLIDLKFFLPDRSSLRDLSVKDKKLLLQKRLKQLEKALEREITEFIKRCKDDIAGQSLIDLLQEVANVESIEKWQNMISTKKPAVQVEGERGKLDFRILPNGVGSSRHPISPFELPKYIEALKKNGPEYGKDYVWLPLELKVGKEQDNLVKQEYDGRTYVLSSNKNAETMLDDGSWNITGVNRERDSNFGNYHSITARFDEYGQHLFSSLTNRHVNHAMAIVRDGKVIYTTRIKHRMQRAAIEGDFTEKQTANLMYIFEQLRKPSQDLPPFLHNIDRQTWGDYQKAGQALQKGQDRAKLAGIFTSIGKKYPQTRHCQIASDLGRQLKVMVEEDKRFKEPQNVNDLNQSEQIEYYIYKLRDLQVEDFEVPGKIRFIGYGDIYKRMGTPAAELRKMGTDVVPALIEVLKDRRPTRSVGGLRNGGTITRNCDVALEIIESIAGRKFDFRSVRGSYLSTASERLRDKIIEDVKQWWRKNRQKFDMEIEVEKTVSDDLGGDSKRNPNITFKDGMSIRDALRFLGKAYKKNIIPSDKVAGQVPVSELYDVTFEEALQAILGTHKYIIDGKFIRVYTKEEFESIYPDHKTDVQIEVEKSQEAQKVKEVYLPNIDKVQKMLDLDSGELLAITGVNDDDGLFALLDKRGKSVVLYDGDKSKGNLAFFMCKISNRESSSEQGFSVVTLGFDELPFEFNVETLDGSRYRIKTVKADDYQCQLEYYQLGHKTDVQIKPDSIQSGYSATFESSDSDSVR